MKESLIEDEWLDLDVGPAPGGEEGPTTEEGPTPATIARLLPICWLLYLLAGPYRALAYRRIRVFPALVGLPVYFSYYVKFSDEWPDGFMVSMGVLLAAIYIHIVVRWLGNKPEEKPWAGPLEPLVALLIGAMCLPIGSSLYVLVGYFASLAIVRIQATGLPTVELPKIPKFALPRLPRIALPKLALSIPEPAIAGPTQPIARPSLPIPSLGKLFSLGFTCCFPMLALPWKFLKAVTTGGSDRQTFMGRVMVFLVGTALWNFFTGNLGFGWIFRYLVMFMAFLLAQLGYEIKPPADVEIEVESRLKKLERKLEEAKDRLGDRIEDGREEVSERIEAGKEKVKDRIRDGKEKVGRRVQEEKKEIIGKLNPFSVFGR